MSWKRKKTPQIRKRNKTLKKLGYADYSKYLTSEHWKRLRTAYYNRYGARCNICGTEKNIELHHKSYDRIGKERFTDLECLCRTCHKYIHNLASGKYDTKSLSNASKEAWKEARKAERELKIAASEVN